jgi:DtxR family Mn-dependent transcriptional regulator
MPSESVENYVRQIYLEREFDSRRGRPSEFLGMKRLADAMGVVPGTATAMVKGLAREGLVTYEPRRGSRLTPRGERLALLVSRRHRLLELFLVRVLGLDWAAVHEEAHRIEHAVSDRLAGALSAYLGNPRYDPHGDPIPAPDGTLPKRVQRPLSAVPTGRPVRVSRILNQEPGFLRFALREGLLPDTEVKVLASDAEAGVLTVRTPRDEKVNMSLETASHILTRPLAADRRH